MPPLRLSVILPTYNRVASLRQALQALLRQSADPASYEVVVVSNNCTDGTAEMLASIEDPRVRAIDEPRQGLSFARNTGITASRGDIVALTDDDVEVAPDWVRIIVSTLDANGTLDGVGGRVLPCWTGGRPGWLTRAHWPPLALQDHGDGKRVFDAASPIGLVGANVAFRRSVFDRVGLFSPDVQRVKAGIGSTEDHDLLIRLYAASGRMLYHPKMLVMARVQPERCRREYHRRWHEGHGRFHAVMRDPLIERARTAPFGVPGHLLRSAVSDVRQWTAAAFSADWERAFAAELRLRFFTGFLRTRLGRS